RLEAAVVAQLRRLRLRHARFRVVVEARPDEGGLTIGDRRVAAGSEGVDEIDFRLATPPGGVPIPLGQGPSGGELSRLALAVRAVDGEERVAEVARLMSGRQTAAALARARELLEEGGLRSPRRAAATIGPG